MTVKQRTVIVGAGLCGTLLALRLAQRGIGVDLVEKRPDPRKSVALGGRSINLALSSRGLLALERVGLSEKAKRLCIPMHGRMIHPTTESPFLSKYSARPHEYINSISRASLNRMLIDSADEHDHVHIHFDLACSAVDLKHGTVSLTHTGTGKSKTITGDAVFGTDGAGSVVREEMRKRTRQLLFNYSQDFLRHGYKELTIPPMRDGEFRLGKNALHIWPRGEFMVIALPNLDASFTVTMFHPFEGPAGFSSLNKKDRLQTFFEENYPDLLAHMPAFTAEYQENPTGILGTIKCYPWQAFGKVCLLGDAAHAIVPFYGQGMNASFEDVRVLDDVLNEHGTDWPTVFADFQTRRKPDTDAIADLAIDNFIEMRDRVDDPDFIRKRQIEMVLEATHPDYYSKYSMVTFKPDLPYREAMIQGRLQDKYLLQICRDQRVNQTDPETVYRLLQEKIAADDEAEV